MNNVITIDKEVKNIISTFYKNQKRHKRVEAKYCPYKHKCKEYVYSNELKKYICKKGVCAI